MGATINPRFPALARPVQGSEVPLSDAPAATSGSVWMRNADGNEFLVVGGQGFTAYMRLPSGEDQLWVRPAS